MKIIVVVPYLTSMGGAARYAWELSEYLASMGDDVVVVSLYSDRKLYDSKNLRVVDLENDSSLTQSIKFWINLQKITNKLSALIKIEKPDLVFFNHFPSTLWARKYDNIPVLCYPQDINLLYTNTYINNLPLGKKWFWRILRIFVRPYDKKRWQNFDQVICNSKFSTNHISRIYKVAPVVIYPGTNIEVFKPSNSVSKQNAILTMADAPIRRADFLIKAANILSKKRNDFKIWIVGSSGKHEYQLKKLVNRYNLEDIVEFYGKVTDSKLAELHSKSLAVVHLIKEAPFGLIAIEAMACGTPVISWKPSGTEETIIHNETGFLINENDYDSLIDCIEKFLDNPELSLTMGQKARTRIQNYFEMKKQYKKLRDLMQKCMNEKLIS